MKLVPFERAHYESVKLNRFSDTGRALTSLDDETCIKHSLLAEDGKVMAIVVFKEVAPRDFAGFFIVDESFTAKHCVYLRNFVQMLTEQHKAERVWTISRQDPSLASWHKFLGLSKDGTMEVENKTYDVWSMTHGN